MDGGITEPRVGEPASDDRLHRDEPDPADPWRAGWEGLRGVLHERLHLFTLEARLAGLTLVQLVFYGVVAALLVVTAWLALAAGIVVGLVGAGLHWALALLLAIVLNLAGAGLLARAMAGLARRMNFEATLRRLRPRRPTDTT